MQLVYTEGYFLLVPHLISHGEPSAHQELDLALIFSLEKVGSVGERTELISPTSVPSERLFLWHNPFRRSREIFCNTALLSDPLHLYKTTELESRA